MVVNMQNGSGPSSSEVLSSKFADLGKQAQIRCSVIQDIVKMERDYLKNIHYVVDVMAVDLDKCCEQIEYEVEEGHVRSLFGNLTDILEVHENLLASMESLIGQKEREHHSAEEHFRMIIDSNFASTFVKHRDSFKTYEIYCANHTRAEQTSDDILKMSSLKPLFKKWTTEGPTADSTNNEVTMISTLLSKPLHHITRLGVMLKILAVFTPEDHPDLESVFSAIQIAHGAVMAVEASKRGKLLQRAYALCEELQKKWDEHGLCNKEGFLTKRGGNVKTWKIRWFTLRSNELKYFDEPVDEKALTTLDLRLCTAVVESDSHSKPNCFGLTFSDRTYYMYAISPCEKSEWMNLIAWKLYVMHSPEERARLAVSSPHQDKITSVIQLLKC